MNDAAVVSFSTVVEFPQDTLELTIAAGELRISLTRRSGEVRWLHTETVAPEAAPAPAPTRHQPPAAPAPADGAGKRPRGRPRVHPVKPKLLTLDEITGAVPS